MFDEAFVTINHFLSLENPKNFIVFRKLYRMGKTIFVSIMWGYPGKSLTIFYLMKVLYIRALEDIMDHSPMIEGFPNISV